MDEVARACGTYKKTLYGLFANKYELMETFVAGRLTTWFTASYNRMCSKPPKAVFEICNSRTIIEPTHRKLHYRMFDNLEKYYCRIWRALDSFMREEGQELKNGNIFQGIEECLYLKNCDTAILANMRLCQRIIFTTACCTNRHLRVNSTRPPDITSRVWQPEKA